MPELCYNGHVRTEANTRWHKRGRGDKLKRICTDCRWEKTVRTGKPNAMAQQVKRTTELHEDVEDLIRFGATFQEIVQRSGFSNWEQMSRSLRNRGRTDLLEKLRIKRGDVYQSQLTASVIPGKPVATKTFGSSARGRMITENH